MSRATTLPGHPGWNPLVMTLMPGTPLAGSATEVAVRVSGRVAPLGQVGCSRSAGANGLPMDIAKARAQWQVANAKVVVWRYAERPAGACAAPVDHDLRGKQRMHTNLVVLPTERWGLANNTRTGLRALRFDEASFRVRTEAREVVIGIQVGR